MASLGARTAGHLRVAAMYALNMLGHKAYQQEARRDGVREIRAIRTILRCLVEVVVVFICRVFVVFDFCRLMF